MISASSFVTALHERGFRVHAGVPCSYLTPLINYVIDSPDADYVGAANEGDAVAIACGAELGGQRGVVLFQNSGFGNAVNPLTSLALPFRIPVLVIVTRRGTPQGPPDEPQHGVMGGITPGLLELMGIPWEAFPRQESEVRAVVERALDHMRSQGTPYALMVPKGSLEPYALRSRPPERRLPPVTPLPGAALRPMPADEALAAVRAGAGEACGIVATTGFTGRALCRLGDRPNQLYMVGSMGCASSLGLGLAKVRPERRFVVIDGDGAVLMRMGALGTIGFERPRNLVHVVLDNGVHDSTGAQSTVSPALDLAAVAQACGYRRVVRAGSAEELEESVSRDEPGPTFVHALTEPRQDRRLPRPAIPPAEVALRFRSWLETSPCRPRAVS